MRYEKKITGAKNETVLKATINTDPEIIRCDELEQRLQDYWSEILPGILNSEYIYIRKVKNHIEIGPANVEYIQ